MRKGFLLLLALFGTGLAGAQTAADPTAVIRYHYGDDARWAAPDFDDSAWPTAPEGKIPMPPAGSDGFVWIRAHLTNKQHTQEPLAILQSPRAGGPRAEQLFVNGVLVGTLGALPPHPVPWMALQRQVFPVPPQMLNGKATAVVALRGWMTWQRFNKPIIQVQFALDRADLLASRAREAKLLAWIHLSLVLVPAALLIPIGAVLVLLWRRTRRRELADFAASLFASAGYCFYLQPIQAGLIALSIPLYLFFYIPIQFLSPTLRAYSIWIILDLPDRAWLRTSVAMTGVYLACTSLLEAGRFDASMVHFLAATSNVAVQILGAILIVAVIWDILRRRNPLFFDIALLLPSLFSSLDNLSVPGSWQFFHLGAERIAYFYPALILSCYGIAAALVARAWRAWQTSERLQQEVAAAQQLQRQMIGSDGELPGFRFAAAYLPATELGGDFYCFASGPKMGALLITGDVSGKGVRAALTVSVIIGAFRSLHLDSPGDILSELNRLLTSNGQDGFVTCLCASIAPDGSVTLANAGHLGPYLRGREVQLESGLPLGIIAGAEYSETVLALDPGDTLTLLSDGVVEAQNPQRELFGFERTAAISTRSAEEIARAAQQFGQEDDITVLTVARVEHPQEAIA